MATGLLIDNDQVIADWVHRTFNVFPLPANKAVGIVDAKGSLCGGFIFQNFNGINVELSYYGPHTISLGICRIIARITLGHFNAGRLTVVTSRKNRRLVRGLIKIGFKLEGTQRCFYGYEDSKKNTAVRLVAFRPELAKVAYKTKPEKKQIEIK